MPAPITCCISKSCTDACATRMAHALQQSRETPSEHWPARATRTLAMLQQLRVSAACAHLTHAVRRQGEQRHPALPHQYPAQALRPLRPSPRSAALLLMCGTTSAAAGRHRSQCLLARHAHSLQPASCASCALQNNAGLQTEHKRHTHRVYAAPVARHCGGVLVSIIIT